MKLNKKVLEEQFIVAGEFNKKEFKKFKKEFTEFDLANNKKKRITHASAKTN